MRNGVDREKIIIVTTSWDDGHPLDVRLAKLLSSYGILGTFYVPLNYGPFPIMAAEQIRTLKAIGMEIGSHTQTHPVLTKLSRNQVLHELVESKRILENVSGEPVVSLAYPKGKFNSTIHPWVAAAGYKLARTTVSFRTEMEFAPLSMPVSFQFFRHPRTVHIRHALKERNLRGIMNWHRFWRMESDLVKLSELMLEHLFECEGILHIWGHSWEIEEFGLWGLLEAVLSRVANQRGVLYLTNSQTLEAIRQ
ncbi:MAG: polysaccharide deacetylase family protein [Candidatus Entotheonellia bacterium]